MLQYFSKLSIHKFVDFISLLMQKTGSLSGVEYWAQRARVYGVRSVLNIAHTAEEIDGVTKMQKDRLFPLLKKELNGREELILDFGCGPGRFTSDLSKLIHGNAIGVDLIKHLLDLAPKSEKVEYLLMQEGVVSLKTDSVDVVWVCLVLGGIIDEVVLHNTISELNRILRTGGLVFLVENTSEKTDGEYWKFRSLQFYKDIFNFVELRHISDYLDLGERISILTGVKL